MRRPRREESSFQKSFGFSLGCAAAVALIIAVPIVLICGGILAISIMGDMARDTYSTTATKTSLSTQKR